MRRLTLLVAIVLAGASIFALHAMLSRAAPDPAFAASRAAATCQPKGAWPGPRGRTYLNEFASGATDGSGKCGYFIAAHTFTNIALSRGVNTMETAITVNGTMTLPASATLTGVTSAAANTGLTVRGAFMAGPGSRVLLSNDATSVISGKMVLAHDSTLALYSAFTSPSMIVYGSLTVAGGGSILLPGGPLCCGSSAVVYGTFNLLGTPTHPVRVRSGATPAGGWHTIDFEPGSHGTVQNTRISDGSDCFTIDGGDLSITNSTFTHCKGVGVSVTGGTPSFANDTFTSNSGVPIRYSFVPSNINATGLQAAMNGAAPNYTNYLTLGGNPIYRGQGEWRNPGIPIFGGSMTVPINMSLTIDPGTVITTALQISGGALVISGTATQPVRIFAGTQYANDVIAFTNGALGQVNHALVNGVGGFDGILIQNSSPSIVDSSVTHALNGVVISDGAPVLTGDTFENNNAAIVYNGLTLPRNITTVTNLHASGNKDNNLLIFGGNLKSTDYRGAGTWADPGIPIEVGAAVNVTATAALTLRAGVTVLDANCSGFQVRGAFNMAGLPGRPVTLKNIAQGNWGTIDFLPGSSGILDHARLIRGGGSGCGSAASIMVDGSSPTVTHTVIESSHLHDVEVLHQGAPILIGNSFLPPSDVFSFGVFNLTPALGPQVNAAHNWWGSGAGPGKPGGPAAAASAGVLVAPWLKAPPTL